METEENYRIESFLNATEDNLAVVDASGIIVAVNDAWSRFGRMNCAQDLGTWGVGACYFRPGLPNSPTDPQAEEAYEGVRQVQAGMQSRFELEYRCDSPDRERHFTLIALPILQKPGWALVAHRDITARRQLERRQMETLLQLAQAQKMESIGQLAGGISHDLNNMLAGIMGAADLLIDSQHLTADDRGFVQSILKTTGRAAELTSKLLAFSRKAGLVRTRIDLDQLFNETVLLLNRTLEKNCTIVLENSAVNPFVEGDATLLQNAFINLGLNGAHAMPSGGVLTFSLKDIELGGAFCTGREPPIQPGTYIEVMVQDTGCGVPPENLQRIFEPFFTTKEAGKGTGLGLSVVQGLVHELGGTILVESEVGQGTTFRLYLPAAAAAPEARVEKGSATVSGSGLILIVDDEPLIRSVLGKLVESLGYRALLAEDGVAALERFRDHRNEVVLVLMDMAMPKLSGSETFRRLRLLDPNVRAVLVSGHPEGDDYARFLEEGFLDVVRKPFRKSDFSRCLANAICSPQPQSFELEH
jgi:signal transduction histidine kinase/CheY-like chemotaxis protein